ncbi:MAG: NAD-dependent epimerase/dehydratase family protein, partial [Thermoplasmata archaeon]|nr:NAD-dependent epimerase/dehydratase family protein [Thermoplasmata archaeon]
NVGGTLNALEHARKKDTERFIFASSYTYGPPNYLPTDEEHPLNPTNPYARSKVLGEELCKAYCEDHGLRCVILRPFNIYGPGGDPRMLIPKIARQLREGRVELFDPTPRRDYVYIDDVLKAYELAGLYAADGCEVFNIASGVSYSVKEVVDLMVKISGQSPEITFTGEKRKGEIPETRGCIDRARDMLGWSPSVSFEEGLERLMRSTT